MNNFLIEKYSLIEDRNLILKKIKFYAMQRLAMRLMANVFTPIWFMISNIFYLKKLDRNKRKQEIIISLTSFPARIGRIWLVIECMLRQSVKPDRIILWLSKDQFDGIETLPKRLLKLERRGLEIVLCDGDLRSHKKYFYAVKAYPNDLIITIDDDVFYPHNTIEKLISLGKLHPECAIFNRGLKVNIINNEVTPYSQWNYLYDSDGPSFDLLLTGCGGVLYPPHSLHSEVTNENAFMSLCKNADDLWLFCMLLLNNTKLVKTKGNVELIPILNRKDITLSSSNVDLGLNDVQLKNIRDYFLNNHSKDVLENLIKTK